MSHSLAKSCNSRQKDLELHHAGTWCGTFLIDNDAELPILLHGLRVRVPYIHAGTGLFGYSNEGSHFCVNAKKPHTASIMCMRNYRQTVNAIKGLDVVGNVHENHFQLFIEEGNTSNSAE